jgi:DNA-binding beta-propeller fold protein YncE
LSLIDKVETDLGNIYVAANSNNIIKKITPQGVATVFAGAGDIGFTDGKGASAKFNLIVGLAIDAFGNLWVADRGNNNIRKITKDGTVTTIAGGNEGYADGEGAQAQFYSPYGIAVDKNGVVYVSEMGNNRIRKIEYK